MTKTVLVEISARHVHVSRNDLDVLFGKGYQLTFKKDLSQPGQFACEERVTVVGPKGELKNVIILGPERPDTQVELSLTDARTVGIVAPVRESGNVEGTPGCTLIGPAGSVEIPCGVIAAKRHVHLTPEAAAEHGVVDKQIVELKVVTDQRTTTFGDVVIRVSDKFAPAAHVDTDEANAAAIPGSAQGEIIVR